MTKFEDLGNEAALAMLNAGKSLEDYDGKMNKVNKTAEESFGQRFQSLINTAKDSLQPLGNSILNIAEKYLPPVIEALTNAAKWFEGLSGSGQKMVLMSGAIAAALPLIGLALSAVLTPLKLVFSGFAKLISFFTTGSTGVSLFSNIVSKLGVAFNAVRTAITVAFHAVKAFLGPVGIAITVITGLWWALKYAYKHSETFRNAVNTLKDGLVNAWNRIKSFNVSATVSKMWTSVKNYFSNGYKNVKEKMSAVASFIAKTWTATKAKAVSIVTGLWNSIKNFFTSGYNTIKQKMTAVKTTLSNIWKNVKDDTVKKVTNMIDFVKKMPSKMADGIAKGATAMKKGAKKMLNGMISGVEWGLNKVVGGVNKVLGWVGAETTLEKVSLPKYAKGTPNKGHAGGLAMVNDAKGSNYKELIRTPDGQTFIPEGRNVVMNLPKGTEVLSGKKTKDLKKKGVIPQYKSGIGEGLSNLWQGAKNIGSSAFSKVKDWSTAVWDWVSSPDKIKSLLMNVIGNVLPESYSSGMLPSMMKGMMNTLIDKAKSFIFNLTESMGGGDFGSYKPFTGDFNKISNKMGVYDYLYDLGKQIVSKFKDTYSGLYISSGKRKSSANTGGVVSDHTTGLGLDLARGGVRDNSYYAMAKSLQNHPYLKMVIGSNMWSKNGSAFSKYPYAASSPHDNHLHLSAKSPSEAKKSSGGGTGAGVEQWKGIATKALRMTGDYSAANLKALLYQMSTESSGNAKAINLWDSNAKKGIPSQGLMQVIPPTFKAYAMKGYNKDIYDPLSNLLASIRYTKSRYGSLLKGWKGKGYANGGIIRTDQIARIGEGNKPEAIIPLSKGKRSRALDLLSTAVGVMGGDTKVDNNNNSNNTFVKQLVEQNNQMIQLLAALLQKDIDVYLDGQMMTDRVNKINEVTNRRERKLSGGYA